MAHQCKQCGAELLPEMRFCRRCGNATGILSVTEGPTRELESATAPGPQGGMTSAAYVPGYPSVQPPPGRRRRNWPWLLVGFLALVMGTAGAVGILLYRVRDRLPASIEVTDEGTKITTGRGEEIVIPKGKENSGERPGDLRTVTTDRVPMSEGDELSLANIAGRIRISTGEEGDEAEIKLVRHSIVFADEHKVDLQITRTGSKISIKAVRGDGTPADVDYDLKIPAGVHLSSITTISGPIEITGAVASVNAKSASGAIRIDIESGSVSAKTVSGDARVAIETLRGGDPVDLSSASGNVSLQIQGDFGADVDVKTVSGDLKIDPSLGLEMEQRVAARRARGRVGSGGTPITIKTISGDVSITRSAESTRE